MLLSALLIVSLGGCKGKISYYETAQEAMDKGNYEEAIENYNKAIMEDEKLQLSYRGAGISYFMTGDYDKAEEFFVRGLQEADGVVRDVELDMSYYLAEIYVCKGQDDKAIDVYTDIINFDSKQTDARIYRGTLYAKLNQTDKAKEDFKEVVLTNKDSVSIYYHCYNALASVNDEEAETYLQKGIACKDDSKEGLYMKGCLYKASNNLQEAKKFLEESKTAGYGKANYMLGQIAEEQGDYQTAIACYNDYMKVENPDVSEYERIINCKILNGDYDSAMENIDTAISNAGESQKKALRFEQIVILEKTGNYDSAKEKMNQYLSDYPDDENAKRENIFLKTR